VLDFFCGRGGVDDAVLAREELVVAFAVDSFRLFTPDHQHNIQKNKVLKAGEVTFSKSLTAA
jgi:hypothetical protein